MKFIVCKQEERKAENKNTVFFVRNRRVEPRKIKRAIKRMKRSENELLSPTGSECLSLIVTELY